MGTNPLADAISNIGRKSSGTKKTGMTIADLMRMQYQQQRMELQAEKEDRLKKSAEEMSIYREQMRKMQEEMNDVRIKTERRINQSNFLNKLDRDNDTEYAGLVTTFDRSKDMIKQIRDRLFRVGKPFMNSADAAKASNPMLDSEVQMKMVEDSLRQAYKTVTPQDKQGLDAAYREFQGLLEDLKKVERESASVFTRISAGKGMRKSKDEFLGMMKMYGIDKLIDLENGSDEMDNNAAYKLLSDEDSILQNNNWSTVVELYAGDEGVDLNKKKEKWTEYQLAANDPGISGKKPVQTDKAQVLDEELKGRGAKTENEVTKSGFVQGLTDTKNIPPTSDEKKKADEFLKKTKEKYKAPAVKEME